MTIKALNKAEEKEYAPKEGDTLEKIAEKEEMTWQELALYNWRTVVPGEVNRALFETIGCESMDPENPGKTVLSPKNGPKTAGKILTPKVWIMKEDEIEPDKTYAVTLKKQTPPLSPLGISKLDKWFIPKLETCDIKFRLDGRGEDVKKVFCEVYGSKYCEASDWNEGRGTYSELENAVLFSKEADKPPVGSEAFASFESERWRGEANAKKGILGFKNKVGEDSREERYVNVAFSPYTVVVKHFKDKADEKAAIELLPFWPQFKEADGSVITDSLVMKWKVHETEKLKLGALLIWDKNDKLVFSKPLEAKELAKDAESKFEWDGKYNEGLHWDQTEYSKPENGDGQAEISARDMPYRFQIQAHSDYKEEEGEEGKDLALAAMHTEVRLYVHPKTSLKTRKNYDPFEDHVSMNLRLGPLTPDEKEPDTEGDKDWYQYKLADAGFHPGPADGQDREDFKIAVREFQRSVPKEKTGAEYERLTVSEAGDTDDDTKNALKSMDDKYKRPWFANDRKQDYPLDNVDNINRDIRNKEKNLIVWVDARHYYTDPHRMEELDRPLVNDSIGNYHGALRIEDDDLADKDAKATPRPWLPLVAEPALLSKNDSLSDEIIISEDSVQKTKHFIGPLRIDWTFEDLEGDLEQIDRSEYNKARVRTYKYVSWALEEFKAEHDYKNPERKVELFNCPEDYGGIRPEDLTNYFQAVLSKDEATSLKPWVAAPDAADESIVTVVHDNIDGVENNIKAKQIGRAGVYFRPSIIAGDGYRVRAQVRLKKLADKYEFPNLENLEKRYERLPQALSAGFRVWRKTSMRGHLHWSSKPSKFEEYMPEVISHYKACHVHFVHEGGSPNSFRPSELVNTEDSNDLDKYKKIITDRITEEHHKNNPDLIELSDEYCFPWYDNKDMGLDTPSSTVYVFGNPEGKFDFKDSAGTSENALSLSFLKDIWNRMQQGILLDMMTRVEKKHGLMRGHLLAQYQDTREFYVQMYRCNRCKAHFWYLERGQAGGENAGKKCSTGDEGTMEIVNDYQLDLECGSCHKNEEETVYEEVTPETTTTNCTCGTTYTVKRATRMNRYELNLRCATCGKIGKESVRAAAPPAGATKQCCGRTYTVKSVISTAPIRGPVERSSIMSGGIGLAGGISWLPNDAHDPITKEPNDGYPAWVWAHEIGHNRHLEHAGGSTGPSSRPALHDSENNSYETWRTETRGRNEKWDRNKKWDRSCAMSYVLFSKKEYDPNKDKPYFCGKCVLRNRGWKVSTIPGAPGEQVCDPIAPTITLAEPAIWYDNPEVEFEDAAQKAPALKIILSFEQNPYNPFSGEGTLTVPDSVEVYKDSACNIAFGDGEKVDFSASDTVELYLKGKNEDAGKISLKLDPPDGDAEVAKEAAEEAIEVKERIALKSELKVEYKAIMLDPFLSKLQLPGETKINTDPAYILLSVKLEDESKDEKFRSVLKANENKVVLTLSENNIEAYADEDCANKLDIDNIPFEELIKDEPYKIFLKGIKEGKFDLTLDVKPQKDFSFKGAKSESMGVVELGLDVYWQDDMELSKVEIDPDGDTYHADLQNEALPDQIYMNYLEKVRTGRVLHEQDDANFIRAKLVIKALDGNQWPEGCDEYDLVLNQEGATGEVELYDAETGGNAVALPVKIKKKDLTADRTYWVEGKTASKSLMDITLDFGLDRAEAEPAKTPKRNGHWARFTVVKIKEVKVDYTAEPNKAVAWNEDEEKFYINLKDDPDGRKVTISAELTENLKGVGIYFMLAPDENNRKRNNWGEDMPDTWTWKDIDQGMKHEDKLDPKNLLHSFKVTGADGKAKQELTLSRFGGDVFYPACYIDQDPHLAKYVPGHAELEEKKPALAAKKVIVWRKLWYQMTRANDFAVPAIDQSIAAFKEVKVDLTAATEKTFDPASAPAGTYYKKWMFKPNDPDTDAAVIGTHNQAHFFGLLDKKADETPKVHIVACEYQYDDKGNTKEFHPIKIKGFSDAPKRITEEVELPLTGKETIIRPYLDGRSPIVRSRHKWGILWKKSNIVEDIIIEQNRTSAKHVKLKLKAGYTPTESKPIKISIKLKLASGPWAGDASTPPHILATYQSNIPYDFFDTVTHEIGHLVNQAYKQNLSGLIAHPDQYNKNGSHCQYNHPDTPCVMYDSGPCPDGIHKFCEKCHPYLLIENMDATAIETKRSGSVKRGGPTDPNEVTPIIDLDQPTLWFDSSEPENEADKAKPVLLALSLDQTNSANPYTGKGTLTISGDHAVAYTDAKCQKPFELENKIDFSSSNKLDLYLKGEKEGKPKFSLKLEKPTSESKITLTKEAAESELQVKERHQITIKVVDKDSDKQLNDVVIKIELPGKETETHKTQKDDKSNTIFFFQDGKSKISEMTYGEKNEAEVWEFDGITSA